MKRLFLLIFMLVLFGAGAMMLTRALGSAQPLNNYLAMLMRDSHVIDEVWCWRGICPGQTIISEARQLLGKQGYKVSSPWLQFDKASYLIADEQDVDTGIVRLISIGDFTPYPRCVTLADAINNFQLPLGVTGNWDASGPEWMIWITFDKNVSVMIRSVYPKPHIYDCVYIINYYYDARWMNNPVNSPLFLKWKGLSFYPLVPRP